MTGPLAHQRIVVTRSPRAATALARRLRRLGAVPLQVPTLRFGPPQDVAALDVALRGISRYDWVVFTSANGVGSVAQRLRRLHVPRTTLQGPALAAIGPSTQRALERFHLPVAFVPSQYLTATLGDQLPGVRDKRILLLRAEVAAPALPRILRRRGAKVDDVAAYRTLPNPAARSAARRLAHNTPPHWILFTSPSTVEHFASLFEDEALRRLQTRTPAATIGPVTSAAARAHGFQVRIEAAEHTIPGLLNALQQQVTAHA